MKSLKKLAAAALLTAGALALTVGSASAEIVCNGEGECWHAHGHYRYHDEWGIVVHPDGWAWGANDHYRWHEPDHPGHGYWHSGIWVRF
jgi:hypothetical protein